jgi:hypothetical protein
MEMMSSEAIEALGMEAWVAANELHEKVLVYIHVP